MLTKSGEFDLNTKFKYSKQFADDLLKELIKNQKNIQKVAKEAGKEKEYLRAMNVFIDRAEKYDSFANQEDDEVKTNRYFNTYNLMYDYKPFTNLFGREMPFEFVREFERVAKTFGISRAVANKVVTTPYFVALPPEEINSALAEISNKLEFQWQDNNVLVTIAKMVACITGIQPLLDGNHRASHAMIQYYLGRAGLPAIIRKKHLKEHYLGYSVFERNAILEDNLDDLISYYHYNILERQKEMCQILGIDPKNVIDSCILCIPDEELGIDGNL